MARTYRCVHNAVRVYAGLWLVMHSRHVTSLSSSLTGHSPSAHTRAHPQYVNAMPVSSCTSPSGSVHVALAFEVGEDLLIDGDATAFHFLERVEHRSVEVEHQARKTSGRPQLRIEARRTMSLFNAHQTASERAVGRHCVRNAVSVRPAHFPKHRMHVTTRVSSSLRSFS